MTNRLMRYLRAWNAPQLRQPEVALIVQISMLIIIELSLRLTVLGCA